MIGALWTGISGLDSHQTALDNESHNIANVNTVGYKSSRISFADQMYQDKIGKGSKVLDAEKLYTQGNLKLTGVSYDMALSGEGFFTVKNTRSSGTAETLYTRAGNFRMGDNGTLQDAAGNEVQGWAMSSIDPDKDVITSNPNISVFTEDYEKLISSKIIRHGNYIETITAKATDYTTTAEADSSTVFTGYGLKSQSGKVADVEALINDYATWLQRLKENPDGSSSTSIAQVSYIDLSDSGSGTEIATEGDQVYVYINGDKISQGFDTDYETTMKLFADKISSIPGMKAYIAEDTNYTADLAGSGTAWDAGSLRIESMIPGQQFTITEAGMIRSGTTTQGSYGNITNAEAGAGIGALESSMEALEQAITGNQEDVYLPDDMFLIDPAASGGDGLTDGAQTISYQITIYDKDLKQNVTIPSAGAITVAVADNTNPQTAIDALVTAINTNTAATGELADYVEAKNINGNLVVSTKSNNYDVEFTGVMTNTDTVTFPDGIKANPDYSGRDGAGAEFIQITNMIDQTASQGSQQLRLDTLSISDSAFGEFSVDATGLITMTQDGAEFAVGQVSIALFNNNRGLEPRGDNLLAKSNESGDPIYNVNNNKTAKIEGKTLELSTADLSESLVNLMVFQRAFEANAKSITTSDQLLNTLINLKRS